MTHPTALLERLWPTRAERWRGAFEDDLDLQFGHFGPTVWCASWEEWRARVRRDAPRQAFLVAGRGGARRVLGEWKGAELTAPPAAQGHFPRLKYYHAQAGWTVAVCFALERQAEAAD